MIDFGQVLNAFNDVRRELLGRRVVSGQSSDQRIDSLSGHWNGYLGSSALASATAASCLCVVAKATSDESRRDAYRSLARRTVAWLSACQNEDGGWGDTPKSPSRLAATMLVRACFHLADAAAAHAPALERAQRYIKEQGGLIELRRQCGRDKTLLALILTNCALAGLAAWSDVPPLAFEFSWLPQPMRRVLGLSTAGYAAPALVASGQARYFHRQPRNPLAWMARRLSLRTSMRVLQYMQPPSGGFFEAVPLTSFVVMSLASTGRVEHDVTRRGIGFILDAVRPDGSWAIDTNLAVRTTSLAVNALSAATGDVGALGCADWLLDCQQRDPSPLTRAAPGGWSWNASRGAAPTSGDTALALLALAVLAKSRTEGSRQRAVGSGQGTNGSLAFQPTADRLLSNPSEAAQRGIQWLLDVQNDDGGWATFSRGQRNLPLEQSAPDNTALAIRALHAWREEVGSRKNEEGSHASLPTAMQASIQRGLGFLVTSQRRDGSWPAVGFGNSAWPRNENPVCGTALVILAYRDLDLMDHPAVARGVQWLAANVDPGGGWGGGRGTSGAASVGASSVEETALALEALLSSGGNGGPAEAYMPVIEENVQWLISAVREGRHRQAAPIGLHLTGLWYDEAIYPLAFTVEALGQAVRRLAPHGKHPPL
jgi:squalene-hopene/tetraprenyl-beta-curcumene cyclase